MLIQKENNTREWRENKEIKNSQQETMSTY